MISAAVLQAMGEELKTAAPRYERAISEGLIRRGDVVPGVPELPGVLGMASRKKTRDALAAPAEIPSSSVDFRRQLNQKKYEQQLSHAGDLVPGATGHMDMAPNGMLAGMAPNPMGGMSVHVPPESGALMRQAAEGNNLRLGGASLASKAGRNDVARQLLGPAAPVDATLNHMVGQHELGEASELGKGVARHNASHLGAEPILREQIAAHGDPEAMRIMARARQQHPDDAMVQGFIRRVGGTPDAPIPVGGRQHRAVERMIDQNVGHISTEAKQRAMMGRDFGLKTPYIPESLPGIIPTMEEAAGVAKKPGLRAKWEGLKTVVGKGKAINSFLRKV